MRGVQTFTRFQKSPSTPCSNQCRPIIFLQRLHGAPASRQTFDRLEFVGAVSLGWVSGAGAILYDARQLFDSHNAKADELLRNVASALPDAVTTCLQAAGAELNPIRQAALMKVRPCIRIRLRTIATRIISACSLRLRFRV